MTDAECTEILAEFRKLRLGPELSAALDHAIGRLSALDMRWASIDPAHPAYPMTEPFGVRLPSVLCGGNMTTTAAQ